MISDKELIEKYFDKALSEEEKNLFKEKYDIDSEFRKELNQQAQIIVALKTLKVQKQLLKKEEIHEVPGSAKRIIPLFQVTFSTMLLSPTGSMSI